MTLYFFKHYFNMFFRMMRIRDLVILSKDCSKAVQFANVSIASSEVHGSHCQFDFCPCSDKRICSVALLSSYARQNPQCEEPLFYHFNGLPVTRFQLAAVLNKAMSFLDIKQVVRPLHFVLERPPIYVNRMLVTMT